MSTRAACRSASAFGFGSRSAGSEQPAYWGATMSMSKKSLYSFAVVAVAIVVACGDRAPNPVSPTSSPVGEADAAADGSNLKVTKPTLSGPADAAVLPDFTTPRLIINNSTATFTGTPDLLYRFEFRDNANNLIEQAVVGTGDGRTGWTPSIKLETPLTTYRWRCRAELASGQFGPWSDTWTWNTPDRPKSFREVGKIFDLLTDGTSVGGVVNVSMIPGVGARLNDNASTILYDPGTTMTEGEFSFVATGITAGAEGDKTKLLSMWEGDPASVTDNDYRFTIEHRGRRYIEPGQMRIRVITGDANNHGRIFDSERLYPGLRNAETYFIRTRWGSGSMDLVIFRGVDSRAPVHFQYAMGYGGTYRPVPHFAAVGAPVGRNGSIDASVAGMTVNSVYLGPIGQRPIVTVTAAPSN